MRIVVLLVVVLAACAGQQGEDQVVQSPPASAVPDAPVEGEILTGTLGGDPQLEGGCAWLQAGDTRWEVTYPQGYEVTFHPLQLSGPDGAVAEEGATVTVVGEPQPDALTVCQVGPVWQATEVRVGG